MEIFMPRTNPNVTLRGDHNECPTCGQLFNSTRAFDRHRTGPFTGTGRRCLNEQEMVDIGMSKSGDWWIGSKRPDGMGRK